ncbi:hypothetical protein M427DRAFT_39129 [Gonapodya prolifera JEL478]|uniref:Uncharacterized protein n=1 Tax=Gonapodya prolifera (strain JEL478) TaxID=1344416 RepID=A0A138ZXY2_GONPJ|nr:hypothetical protein M427DRAFT_39129 [Gonapodya prolifera JEL478]|eukprot:KXS09354.1 hypothetical protein M427DRAFT_39129 [Gonapodya prolifera JEL478]
MRLIPALALAVTAALFQGVSSIPLLARQNGDRFKDIRDAYATGFNLFNVRTGVNVTASAFYKTPANISSNSPKPGDLLKFEQIRRSSLDAQYAYPPSLTLFRPDYAGLASDTQLDYEAGVPHADDASYSVVAMRKSPIAKLGLVWDTRKVLWWRGMYVNEAEGERPVGGFLGSVPIAPSLFTAVIDNTTYVQPNVMDGLAVIPQSSDPAPRTTGQIVTPADGWSYYSFFSIQSAAKLNKSNNLETYLTEKGKVIHRLLWQGGCYTACLYVTAGQNASEL